MNHFMKFLMILFPVIPRIECQCLPLEPRKPYNVTGSPDQEDPWIKGFTIFDYDIAMHVDTSVNDVSQRLQSSADPQALDPSGQALWPDRQIPFQLHPSVNNETRLIIYHAMEHWEEKTCLTFRAKDDRDEYWILFRSDSTGCYSFIGRDLSCKGRGQPVSISHGCQDFLIVVHEIGHAVGLHHQHNRPDRDQAVHINWQNLVKGSDVYFRKESFALNDIPYDYTSIMQYNMWHFSQSIYEKSAMVTLDPLHQHLLGKAQGLSFWDRKTVSLMYRCDETCANAKETCLNGGFLSSTPYQGQDGNGCSCSCLPGTAGDLCERVMDSNYYHAVAPLSCDGRLRSPGLIEIPAFTSSSNRSGDDSCVWLIQSPEDQVVRLKFRDFRLAFRSDLSVVRQQLSPESDILPPDFRCLTESLEVRLNDPYDGSFFCGNDFQPGKVLVSNSRNVTLLLHNFSKSTSPRQLAERRLKIEVDFVDRNSSRRPATSTTSTTTTTPPPKSSTSTFPPLGPSITTPPLEIFPLLSILKSILNPNLLLNVLLQLTERIGAIFKLFPSG